MSARARRGAARAICATVAIACSEPTAPATPSDPPAAAPTARIQPAAATPVALATATVAVSPSSAVDDALDRVIASFPVSNAVADLRRALQVLSGALAGSDRARSERLARKSERALRILRAFPGMSGFEVELDAVALALDAVRREASGPGPE